MGGFAWVTLATNDSYSLGALVLAHSLRQVNTAHQLAVLITPAVSEAMRNQLGSIFDVVKIVDVLDSKDEANLALLKRPELGITFTKLHCWQLTQFEKGVFLDADTLVVRNCDELFEREEFSAAPDVGWPDCFNSGVFVFRPSLETFNNLIQFAVEKGSFDGGDQGLLNQFFNTWATDDIRKHLPFVYNLTSVAVYSYIPAFKQYGAESRIVHFIGPVKPWLQAVDPATRTVTPSADSVHLQPLLQKWWDIFIDKVHPGLSTDLECASGMLTFFAQPACSQEPLDCTHARSDPFPPPPPMPEPQAPDFPDPYTPYIEKDDERQYNLPYQPFQVVSSEGELLNITFADFVRESEPHEAHQDDHFPDPQPEPEREPERHDEHVEPQPEQVPDPEPEPEAKSEERQFDYHQFFPDETVINAYLEHNVQEYQPFDLQPSEPVFEPLPRFLTIPEDDSRQSQKPYEPEPSWCPPQEVWTEPHHVHDRAPSPVPPPPAITKSRSMSNLFVVDATDTSSFQTLTTWKSQPDIAQPVEVPKKLPGLKPLLPKVASPAKGFISPKYTEFTEVNMNLGYSDPFAPPVDNLGFVERAILSKGKTLQPVSSPTPPPKPLSPSPFTFQAIPEINQYVDLLECQRQSGNVDDPSPISAGGVKTFTPKVSPRRMKRSTRRATEKWKPPETTTATYDVDDIIKRLSEFSIGYVPPELPAVEEKRTETRADRLFRGSTLETRPTADTLSNGVSDHKELVKNKSHFGPLAFSSPFAAPSGESLSECDQSVPEIVVCVASPENGLLHAFMKNPSGGEDDTYLTPASSDTKTVVNGENRTSSSEDSFLSAVSNSIEEITERVECMKIGDDDRLGICGVREWEEILEAQLTMEIPVAEDERKEESLVGAARDREEREWEKVLALNSPESAELNDIIESLQKSKPDHADNLPIDSDSYGEFFESALDTEGFVTVSAEKVDPVEISCGNGLVSITETLENVLETAEVQEVPLDSKIEEVEENLRYSSKLAEECELLSNSVKEFLTGVEETEMPVVESVNDAGEIGALASSPSVEDFSTPKVLETTFTVEGSGTMDPVVDIVNKFEDAKVTAISESLEDSCRKDFSFTYTVEDFEKGADVEIANNVEEIESLANNVEEVESLANAIAENSLAQALEIQAISEEPAGMDPFADVEPHSTAIPSEEISSTKVLENEEPKDIHAVDNVTKEVEPLPIPGPSELQPTENASTPPISYELFSNLPTSTPTGPSNPFNASYAAAVKKSAPSVQPVKPVEPVRAAPKPQPKQNGLKRPRKPKHSKPVAAPSETKTNVAEIPPPKYNKRKIEKTDQEYPANRFELLPEETLKNFNHPQKRSKKSKKFATPASSLPLSLPTCSSSVDDEEDATPHLPEPDDNPGIAGAIAQLNLEPGAAETDVRSAAAQAEYLRRQSWETGKVDYMGRDSFANVWSKISETLSQSAIEETKILSSSTVESRPISLSMILDPDSIETLPSDATLSPGEAADDDIIFDRQPETTEPSNILPGILEESEEADAALPDITPSETQPTSDTTENQTNPVPVETIQEATSSEKHDETPPPSPPIGSDSSAFATYKPAKEPDPAKPLRRQSSSEEKRGVFTKILEFVGVVKKKEDVETSIFYDDPSPPRETEESSGVEGIQEILKATDLSTIQDEELKKRSPSPRVTIAAVPQTYIIAATPPTHPDQKPPRRDPEALTVDNTIPETPPVVEKKTPIFVDRDSLLEDIDGIIEKAKMIAQDELNPVPVFCSSSVEPPKPPIAILEEFEEIRVTTDEEKKTVKTSSKLSEQILKAIPPPRRKAISDSKIQQSVSVQVEKVLDVVSEQPPPVPPRRRNRSKQRADK